MRLHTELPREYGNKIIALAPFDEKGKITERVKAGLENTLYLYSELGRKIAKETENNPRNLRIERVLIVGSAARANKIDSDLDFLLIAPFIDELTANFLKTTISYVLFCDRPKQEAIDVFVRHFDKYPSRGSKNITSQVRGLIEKYNKFLQNPET